MQTALLDMQAASQQDNQAQVEKVALDFEAKVLKVVADLEAKRLATESQERVARDTAAAEASAKQEEKPKKEAAPVIHIHMPSGKKKISKDKDGSYLAEDVD